MTDILAKSSPQIVLETGGIRSYVSASVPLPAASEVSVRWIDTVNELEAIRPQWESLVEHAVYRNAAFEHNFLIPAFKHLNDGNVRILIAEDVSRPAESGGTRLLGLLPLVATRIYHLPIRCFQIWNHDQGFDSTPLLEKASAVLTLDAMLDFITRQRAGLFGLDCVSGEPEMQAILDSVIQNRQRSVFQRSSFQRAALRPLASGSQEYVKQFVSKSVKKNYGRLSRRLAEQGEVTLEVSDDFSDYETLASQFLNLENSGWKSESGTALACQASTRRFYEEFVQRSAQLGKSRFVTLNLDNRPIAMLCDIHSGNTVFSYKTAFDETYSQFSPGLQIEILNIERMHQQGIEYADSCTEPDNATINRIWGQRLNFQSLVIGLRPGVAQLATSLMPWIQATAARLKRSSR